MANHVYGIDFGTSNSVLAIVNTSSRQLVNTLSENSVIYFRDAETHYIGKQAVREYLEHNMQGRLLKSIKTLLPQPGFTFTYIFGKKYTAEDLVYLILSYLKRQADALIGEEVDEVVLGRPVVFSEEAAKDKLAEERLITAAKKAGFNKIRLQYEPIAAGFLYEQSVQKPETVLIGDFGGGTSDFTLMKLDRARQGQSDRRQDIIKTAGIHIGGDDFDSAVMWNKLTPYFGYGLKYESYGKMLDLPVHIFRTLCEWEQMAFLKEGRLRKSLDAYYLQTNKNAALLRLMQLIDNNLGFSLFQSIEKAKIELSANDHTPLQFTSGSISINDVLERQAFDACIQPDINRVDDFLDSFLTSAQTNTTDIDNVFITGGASSVAAVLAIFLKRFPSDKVHAGDNFNSVAQGLALSYFHLS